MIAVIGMWEPGFREYEQIIEYRVWKQSIRAFDVDRWIMVGEGPDRVTSFETFEKLSDALQDCEGRRVFARPGLETADQMVWQPCELVFDPVTYVFGHADESLAGYVTGNDVCLTIPTPKPVDMFACAVLPLVLHGAH